MEEICLDTDFIIDFLVGQPDAMLKLLELTIFGKQPITTAVNISELYRGITLRQWQEKRKAVLDRFVKYIKVLPLSKENSPKVGELLARLKREGRSFGYQDTAIAGIAICVGIPLLTRNIEHFSRCEGLELEHLEAHSFQWTNEKAHNM